MQPSTCASSPVINQRYWSLARCGRAFLPLYQQLDVLFERGISFDEFADRIRSRIQTDAVAIEDFTRAVNLVDIVYSNGVLQHIADLDRAVDLIQLVSHASTRQFHVVNFTDHVSPPNDPFREIYSLDPAEYFEHDSLLNLKRPSEVDIEAGHQSHRNNVPYANALGSCPLFAETFHTFRTAKASFRLLRRSAGSAYSLHDDRDMGDDIVRIQLPVVTNPNSLFLLQKDGVGWSWSPSRVA